MSVVIPHHIPSVPVTLVCAELVSINSVRHNENSKSYRHNIYVLVMQYCHFYLA